LLTPLFYYYATSYCCYAAADFRYARQWRDAASRCRACSATRGVIDMRRFDAAAFGGYAAPPLP